MNDPNEPVPGVVIRGAQSGLMLTVEPTTPGDHAVQLWAYNEAAGGAQAGIDLDFQGCVELMLAIAQRMRQMQCAPDAVRAPDGTYLVPAGRRRYEPMVWLAGEADGHGWAVWDYATRTRVSYRFGPMYLLAGDARELADGLNTGVRTPDEIASLTRNPASTPVGD